MATIQQGHDRIGSIKLLNASTIDAEETSFGAENLNEQPPPSVDVRIASPNLLCDSNTVNSSRDALGELGTDAVGDGSTVYPSNIYAPQAHAFYYGGYQNTTGEWEEYPHYLNAEGMEVGSNGIYNENPSVMFHTSYGYSPQMPYGPYSPATTPLPSAGGDGQLYSTQHFQFGAPYYQQPAPPSMSYLTSPTPMSQPDLTMPVGQQGPFLADASNSNGMLLGQGPSYPLPYGSFGGGSFAGNYANPSFHDLRQGFDGVGSGGLWADWKSPDAVRSLTPLSSPAASAQPVGAFRSFGQSITPLASGMASQQERAFHDFGSSVRSYDRGCSHGGMYHQGRNFGGSISSLEMNGQAWIAIDKGRRRGKGNASLCNCNGMLDFLNEQNRGPRAIKPKNPATEWNSSLDSKNDKPTARADHELYNRPDFVTEYKDAKFFIIKSYSEDNVHKSIKYGVWASTANGNRKLDSAYHEAKEKGQSCPVFLFFSVNASAQFCGLAEMIGPVDFDKSVDYWQQDKWSGQFLVKWHMVKDVPNSLFRHIILENNDNKPVTNSRDTQEVKLEQGLEMLDLFKKHESSVSILDDFDFYEERQEAMQERKARQQQQHQQQHQSKLTKAVPAAVGYEQWNPAPTSGEFINQMSENFANAVRLQETSNEVLPTEKSSSVITAPKRGDLTESAVAAETQSSD